MDIIANVNEEGHLVPQNLEEIKAMMVSSFEGKDVEVSIKAHKRKRSNRQNRWYWGVAIPTVQSGILEQTGILEEKETIHALILSAVGGLTMETKHIMGMNVIRVNQKRTSDMSVEEFSNFFERVIGHFAEKGIVIPEPTLDNFYNQVQWKDV